MGGDFLHMAGLHVSGSALKNMGWASSPSAIHEVRQDEPGGNTHVVPTLVTSLLRALKWKGGPSAMEFPTPTPAGILRILTQTLHGSAIYAAP